MATKKQRAEILAKSGGYCWYCGCDISDKKWHIDHLLPVLRVTNYYQKTSNPWCYTEEQLKETRRLSNQSELGKPKNDTFENKVPSCISCNLLKSKYTTDQFRKTIINLVRSLNKYNNSYKNAKRYGLISEVSDHIEFWFELNNK